MGCIKNMWIIGYMNQSTGDVRHQQQHFEKHGVLHKSVHICQYRRGIPWILVWQKKVAKKGKKNIEPWTHIKFQQIFANKSNHFPQQFLGSDCQWEPWAEGQTSFQLYPYLEPYQWHIIFLSSLSHHSNLNLNLRSEATLVFVNQKFTPTRIQQSGNTRRRWFMP